ncbi:MAG: hypothetical protein AB1646_09825 [Thermodesulfobacteriota bacterium]
MKRIIAILIIFSVLVVTPVCHGAGAQDANGQAGWAAVIHEENSLRASLLYLPYMVLKVPVAIVHGILYPVPTTQSTSPPPAHAVHR